jgi:hypothetical protein
MSDFKDEMQRAQDRMDRYIEESKGDREESKAERRHMSRQSRSRRSEWGGLARHCGAVAFQVPHPGASQQGAPV